MRAPSASTDAGPARPDPRIGQRVAWVTVTASWLVLAAGARASADMLGFPDGHLTALDQARRLLLPGVSWGAVGGAALTLFFGARRPGLAGGGLLLVLVLTVLVDALLAARLDDGGGG